MHAHFTIHRENFHFDMNIGHTPDEKLFFLHKLGYSLSEPLIKIGISFLVVMRKYVLHFIIQ